MPLLTVNPLKMHSALHRLLLLIIFSASLLTMPAQASNDEHDDHHNESHDEQHDEQPLNISKRMLTLNQISIETATDIRLQQKTHLFGIITAIPEQQVTVKAPYTATVDSVMVQQGDSVSKGQVLVNLTNISSLKSYQLRAPLAGVITQRYINNGELVRDEALFEIANHNKVYVEMSAFPSDTAQLKPNLPVSVFSLHQAKQADTHISYISPQLSEGHITRVRAIIDNNDGYWRPGMHIKADVQTAEFMVPLAVKKSALQYINNEPVVFVRHGDNFEVHQLTLGREDDTYIEVLSGLEAGSEYASKNSFILKADVLKSGASHEH